MAVPWTRRDFLRAAGATAVSPGFIRASAGRPDRPKSVILLLLVGGPSQLDSFDPKPDAIPEVRGPFGSIATAVPGVRVVEHLPGVAARLDRLMLIRSLYHDAAPIHETGLQILQTGRTSRRGDDRSHLGLLAARAAKPAESAPPFVLLPGPLGNTGVAISKGQDSDILGPQPAPSHPGFDLSRESARVRDRYGPSAFGRNCLRARRFIEAGTRLVVVNMYSTVFGVSWDCHGAAPFVGLEDYARSVLPAFDRAFAALIDDLSDRQMLDDTLVVATGEFGRSPRINPAGGRDHWPGVWSALLAGGGLAGGEVLGSSDAQGAEPADRPVPAAALASLMAEVLGLATTAEDDGLGPRSRFPGSKRG